MCAGVRDWGGKLLRRPVQTRYNIHVYTLYMCLILCTVPDHTCTVGTKKDSLLHTDIAMPSPQKCLLHTDWKTLSVAGPVCPAGMEVNSVVSEVCVHMYVWTKPRILCVCVCVCVGKGDTEQEN